MARYVGRPRKGRSLLQQAQTRSLTQSNIKPTPDIDIGGSPNSETEVIPHARTPHEPIAIHVTTNGLSKQNEKLRRKYKNVAEREKRARAKVSQLESSLDATRRVLLDARVLEDNAAVVLEMARAQAAADDKNIGTLKEYIHELQSYISWYHNGLESASVQLLDKTNKSASLAAQQTAARRSRDTLRKRAKRAITSKEKAAYASVQSNDLVQHSLKDPNGVIRPEIRNMIRKLTCKGVSTENTSDIVKIVAEALGVDVTGSISARSIARLMLEGLIQARMQIGDELNQANHISICSDGTTIKNQQHESKSIFIQPSVINKTPIIRTLGVHKAAGHTAQQQFDGWIRALDACCDVFSRSPLAQGVRTSSKTIAPKLRGMLTDHASDQKLLHRLMQQWKQSCDREIRAASTLAGMSTEEQLIMLSNQLDNATNGIHEWRQLPLEQKAAYMHDAWFSMAMQIGEVEFQKLNFKEQFEVDYLAWAGCCMHKEMNAVKGGVSRMAATWKQLGLTPPISLKNQFEKEQQSKIADDKSKWGAIKLASLAGALFNNKDEKKGYQKTVDNHFENAFGYSNRFPDTSNTRYGSYCNAATELILHRETFKSLMEKLHSAKYSSTYTNIESNVLNGLKDIPTLTELLVLALYAQSVGRPYIRHVRSLTSNGLELGQFHVRVKEHCAAIIENPDLLLKSDTSVVLATLDGQLWDRPEVLYMTWSLLDELPNTRQLLVAFFEGALEAWERFTSEFGSNGLIMRSTPAQLQSAFVPATNDLSEGSLGQCRQVLRRAPTMTDEQRNARVMWQHNGTYAWAKQTLTDSDELFVRHEARSLDASGASKKRRAEINQALEERAAAGRARIAKANIRRRENDRRLNKVTLLEHATYEKLLEMKIKDLDGQIDKLRALGDKIIRPKTAIGNKHNKIKEILAGLERRRIDKHSEQGEIWAPKAPLDKDNIDIGGASEAESLPEDIELCFDEEILV